MKRHIHLAVVRLLSAALFCTALSVHAAVPVRWTAETSRVQPIALDAWRGDTLALECALKSYGQPVTLGAATASLMWQTNGMGSAWWQTNATVSADGVIRATWSPSMDPGAPVVAFFLPVQTGDGASYRAAGTLRFRPSPGAGSQIAELPQPGGTLDFGVFNLVNAPWATLEAANEAISAAVTSATGALVIPPPVDLTPYATTEAVQAAATTLSNDIQLVSNSSSNYTDQVASSLSALISSSTNSLGSVLRDTIAESASASRSYADGVSASSQAYADAVASNAQRSAIAAIPSLSGYATETYVDSAISAIAIPSLSGYATTAYADAAASNAQAAAISAIPSLSGYATQQWTANYLATNYPPVDLSPYATTGDLQASVNLLSTDIQTAFNSASNRTDLIASQLSSEITSSTNAFGSVLRDTIAESAASSRAYADAAASNAQRTAIAAIPSLSGYATETYVDSAISSITIPSLSGYATTAYADAAASNAQSAAIAAIPSLAGYATETYAQNAASSAASDALSAAQSYARDLSWAASAGNTRLVSLDGTTWQDATGTVWKISYIYGWRGTELNLPTTTSEAILFEPVPGSNGVWTAGGGTNVIWDGMSWCLEITNDITYADGGPPQSATNLTFTTDFDQYYLYYLPVTLATNPVDHVIYEQSPVLRDIIAEQSTNAVSAVLGAFASTGTVHAADSAIYSARLFDASYDAAYDATFLIRESTNAAVYVSSAKVSTNALAGQTYDFSRNYDIIRATADIVQLLGGTVTNNPTANQGGN